jgi:pimeloyl-ACP methyl ester carboxylesterase
VIRALESLEGRRLTGRAPRRASFVCALGLLASLASCSDTEVRVRPRVDYEGAGFWDAPFPDERLRRADGTVDASGFPNHRQVKFVSDVVAALAGARGFGTSSTIYFPMEGPLDEASLPTAHESVSADASVVVVDVDPESAERGRLHPVRVAFLENPGASGTPNLLAALPVQGIPLSPGRLHAAVVTTRVRTIEGARIGVASATASLLRGERPNGLSEGAFASHLVALDALRELGLVDTAEIAATAVFRTGSPVDDLAKARDQVLEGALPMPEAPFASTEEVYDDFCVFHTTIRMPVFQEGTPPYESEGGAWVYDANGALVSQGDAESNVWVTVPRRAMPVDGFPTLVFVRTGGGGDRPLIDRGVRSEPGGESAPGSGPATYLSRAGIAGISVDGPLGGLRNVGGWDEQFAVFNVFNPEGLVGSIRQSALELMIFAHVLPSLRIDASSCPDVDLPAEEVEVKLDADRLAIMGHSMGAWIAPLVVAFEPKYRAMILSGAGASFIENVLFKETPIHVRPLAELLLGYAPGTLTAHDPVLAFLGWAGEPADPQVYAPVVEARTVPAHVLMFQGILDTYIPPPIANSLTLPLRLDLAGPALDETLDRFEPLMASLDLVGGTQIDLPASGNRRGGDVTAVLVQHLEDGIEDGHEVVYQRAEPPLQIGCFLASYFGSSVPIVPAGDAAACE